MGTVPVSGQTSDHASGYGSLVLQVPASVEAAAFGNAPNLFGGSADLIFYAPGLIGRSSGVTGSAQLDHGEAVLFTAAGRGSVGLGDFALGLQTLRYSGDGLTPSPDMQGVLGHNMDNEYSELAASLGYGRSILGLDAGAVLTYTESSLGALRGQSVLVSLGVARELGPLLVAFSARHLGRDPQLSETTKIPREFALGASTRQVWIGELDMLATAEMRVRRDGEVIPAGGVELSYWPVTGYTFRLRFGAERVVADERSPYTFGAAFTGDAITLEYAFQSFGTARAAHRLGLSFR